MVVKITSENIGAKVGKRVDVKNVKELNLSKMQVEELSTFAPFESLEKLDLSGNWIKFARQIEKMFEAPALIDLNLSGNPICKVVNYRKFIIYSCSKLKVLDEQEISDEERAAAKRFFDDQTDPAMIAQREREEKLKIAAEAESKESKIQDDKRTIQEQQKKDQIDRENQQKMEAEKRAQEQKALQEYRKQQYKDEEASTTQASQQEDEREVKTTHSPVSTPVSISKVEQPKLAPKIEQSTTLSSSPQRTKEVFVDARTNLVITDRFTPLNEPQVANIKSNLFGDVDRQVLSEDSLFGSSTSKPIKKDDIDSSLFANDDDILKKLEIGSKSKEVVKPSIRIAEDDLFSSKPTTTTKSDISLDDDLFSMISKKSDTKSSGLDLGNLDAYIQTQKKSTGGGLFD